MSPRGRVAALLLAAALTACQSEQITQFRGRTMGTTYSIKVVVPSGTDAKTVANQIEKALTEFDAIFSTYNEKSEISRFNRHLSLEPFDASDEFSSVVRRALNVAERTGGAFDPTVGPLLRLYGFGPGGRKPQTPPGAAAIEAVRDRVGFARLKVSMSGKLWKSHAQLELDLNAIAKGAGVDRIAHELTSLGCKSFMVEVGGEVSCRGEKPGGDPWTLGVADPSTPIDQSEILEKVRLVDRAMATSGSYLQFKQFGKDRVHHILDPRTGKNAVTKVVSVTVIAKSCHLADALATALMVLGPVEGEKVLQGFAGDDVKALYLLMGENGIERREHRWSR